MLALLDGNSFISFGSTITPCFFARILDSFPFGFKGVSIVVFLAQGMFTVSDFFTLVAVLSPRFTILPTRELPVALVPLGVLGFIGILSFCFVLEYRDDAILLITGSLVKPFLTSARPRAHGAPHTIPPIIADCVSHSQKAFRFSLLPTVFSNPLFTVVAF